MTDPLYPVQSIFYRQYIKETLAEGLRSVFINHPDDLLRKTKVRIAFGLEKANYPSIIINYYERNIQNAGIGHFERLPTEADPDRYIKYKHYLYQGDIGFDIYALSTYDRDLMADSLVQILTMGDTEIFSEALLDRVYNSNSDTEPRSFDHFINLNTDKLTPYGDSQNPTPWESDDEYLYGTTYRIEIHGEFYSRTPPFRTYGLIENVDVYPYNPSDNESIPNPHPEDPALWEDSEDNTP